MKDLSEAVLQKVRAEAHSIVLQAQQEAGRVLEKARRLRRERIEVESARLLAAAETEAAGISAQGLMEARHMLLTAKSAVIDDIVRRAAASLRETPATPANLATLVDDALEGLQGRGRVILRVAPGDLDRARELVSADRDLADIVSSVAEGAHEGGVLLESEHGSIVVDNSHATRLGMLVPRILPRLGQELFQRRCL
jgi:vacuolar-type H+-ATPase subunit E/Vma4